MNKRTIFTLIEPIVANHFNKARWVITKYKLISNMPDIPEIEQIIAAFKDNDITQIKVWLKHHQSSIDRIKQQKLLELEE